MKHLFTFTIALICFLTISAQEKDLTKPPAGSAAFIPPGYEVHDFETGDLNGDGRKDVALVLKLKNEDTLEMGEAQRPLLLLTRGANGKLKQAVRCDSLILCRQCGGVFGDPYEGITISKNSITVNFYGGSGWRWGIEYIFKYEAATNNWWLEKETGIYYHSAEPDKMKTTVYKREELGKISIGKMNEHLGACERNYKVTATKTYFYEQPDVKSKPRKGYLLKGDIVSCNRQTANFISVYYTNKKDRSSEGFILKKDLVPVTE
jgi:hypothetical protein